MVCVYIYVLFWFYLTYFIYVHKELMFYSESTFRKYLFITKKKIAVSFIFLSDFVVGC